MGTIMPRVEANLVLPYDHRGVFDPAACDLCQSCDGS